MKSFLFYTEIQFRRILKLLPVFLTISISSFLLIGAISFLFIENTSDIKAQKKFVVGITGEIESNSKENNYINLGVKAIQKLDYSSSYIELMPLDEKSAEKLLRDGEIVAYIIVPEGFIESVNYGRNDKQITFVSGTRSSDIIDLIKSEIADIVSNYVTNVQASIYSMQKLVRKSNKRSNLDKYTIDMNVKFIDYVMKRNDFAEVKITGNRNKVSNLSYYICGTIIFYLMLIGMNCVVFFSKRNMTLSKILYSKGLNSVYQVFAELIAYFFFILVCMALICLVLFALMKLQIFEIAEWKYYSLSFETFLFFLKSIPILILVASFHYFIFEAIHTVVAQVSFLFLIVFILCYISGCFYPSEFFPQIIQTISIHLPVGLAFDFIRKNILKTDIKLPLIEILSYTIIFISLSVFCRRKKLNEF